MIKEEFSRLLGTLNNSKLQGQLNDVKDLGNRALYQTVKGLIDACEKFKNGVNSNENAITDQQIEIATLKAQVAVILAATFLMTTDESALFTSSRELLAGSGVTFDDTVANKRTINASGGYVPVSDGNVANPQIINDGAGNFIYVGYTR